MVETCMILGCNNKPDWLGMSTYDDKVKLRFVTCEAHKKIIDKYDTNTLEFSKLE